MTKERSKSAGNDNLDTQYDYLVKKFRMFYDKVIYN